MDDKKDTRISDLEEMVRQLTGRVKKWAVYSIQYCMAKPGIFPVCCELASGYTCNEIVACAKILVGNDCP
ncbi:MAG: hypothetical protein D9C04_02355 [Nitrosopumilus sp. B06]|nr:MAG: hypothetical protein D9C04_02355 [Nitrosopumilus sp. B06]